MVFVFILGLFLIVGSVIEIYITLRDEKIGLAYVGVLALFLGLIMIFSFIEQPSEPSQKTIKCTEIHQIDTLYKNDSIVGYEIIIKK